VRATRTMILLHSTGSVVLTAANGRVDTIGPETAVSIPRGWQGDGTADGYTSSGSFITLVANPTGSIAPSQEWGSPGPSPRTTKISPPRRSRRRPYAPFSVVSRAAISPTRSTAETRRVPMSDCLRGFLSGCSG